MMGQDQGGGLRRVVVALEAGETGHAALEDAARLAAQLKAELVALLVEDLEPVAAAGLPVTRIVSPGDGRDGALDAAMMRRAYRVWSRNTRQAVEATATRWKVSWSCRATEGHGAEQLIGEAGAEDILALPRSLGRVTPGGDAACSVLAVRRSGALGRPVVVFYQGRTASLAAGLALARLYGSQLVVCALGADAEEVAALGDSAAAWLGEQRVRGPVVPLVDPDGPSLEAALGATPPGLVVYSRKSAFAGLLDRALARHPCSLLTLC